MPSAADRLEFGPPRDAGGLRSYGMALLVHGLLILALTWGLNWKRTDPQAAFQAELWSNVPFQEAAPRAAETPPPPPPSVTPPTPVPPEPKATPVQPEVDIALEQEKKRKLAQQQKAAEAQKLQDKLKAELQAKKEKEKAAADKKAREELAKRKADEAKKVEAKKQDDKDDAREKLAKAAAEKQRQENIKRIEGLAGATGSPDSKGTAAKSSGGSTTYGAIVRAAIKPNVLFTDEVVGNPMAKVEVRLALNGIIVSQRLVQSSGNRAWDDAAQAAITRTHVLPPDINGQYPDSILILEMRPRN